MDNEKTNAVRIQELTAAALRMRIAADKLAGTMKSLSETLERARVKIAELDQRMIVVENMVKRYYSPRGL